MKQFDPNDPCRYPLRFTTKLPFPKCDLEAYPWLSQQDRFYKLEKELDRGGYSIPYIGYPCDSDGKRISENPVVVKRPNLDKERPMADTEIRLAVILKQSFAEWALIRSRLRNCKYANPIFDMDVEWQSDPGILLVSTVQPYLSNAVSLKQYWKKTASQWEEWLSISTLIADGLVGIHERRVIHGDIWPPNIFISNQTEKSPDPFAIFIDFGESFTAIPAGEPRTQPNHPYRAPERDKPDYVPTEQIDVYSFGKLMLYFAIGTEVSIPRIDKSDPSSPPLYGHRRRAWVRDKLFEENSALVKAHPELLDAISQCVELDPVARPTMLEISDQLHEFARYSSSSPSGSFEVGPKLTELSSKIKPTERNRVFNRFVERKVVELERLIDTCESEMVEVTGTRETLIAAMVALIGELGKGDSWTTLTTPSVWQHNALGLDGRYSTATIQAVRRGAAVQRTYAICIEELGVQWAHELVAKLETSTDITLLHLARSFREAIADFEFCVLRDRLELRSAGFLGDHQRRFVLVMQSLAKMIDCWSLRDSVFPGEYQTIKTTHGLYLGLVIVATSANIREFRAKNPVSLLYDGKQPEEKNRWLLVMTDIRGRNENEPSEHPPKGGEGGASSAPQLRRVRIYPSVLGVPTVRIKGLEDLMREKCTNIGASIEELATYLSEMSANLY